MLAYVPAIVAGVFLFLLVLERFVFLRETKRPLVERLFINFCITALAFAVNAAVVQPAAQYMMQWTDRQSFGLIHIVQLPAAVEFALAKPARSAFAFLLMDLTFYYWHRANHRFRFLWRFHNAHHIDPDLDVSTGFRFHFVEIALSAGFRIVQVGLIGVSIATYAIYELIFQANTLFHHSNVHLPIQVERWLNMVLVTPRMHGIHHSQVQEETNSNYSVIFPWWDRLHKTLRLNVPARAIAIGIPAYSEPNDNKLQNILLVPFKKQRDYWRKPDRTLVERNQEVLGEDLTRMIESEDTSLTPNLSKTDTLTQ